MSNTTAHEFKVHSQIIVQLIKRQAGTLPKALLELYQNSVDAGATSTVLELTQDGFVFQDNGKGFLSEQEIHDLFGCVGWPHEEGSRVYGEFGLGRLQILNFASTDWMTNGMQMSVDINTKGMSYEVLHGTNEIKGLRIEGKFFKRLELRDVVNATQEFKTSVKYSPVPVTLNGERIDTDCSKVKWTFETEDAYILISNTRRDISVYNQGVFVRDYSAHTFGGSGGVVVTKLGVRLVLNTARNDIITQDCKAWARIKPFLMDQAKKERKKAVSFKEDNIRFMRHEFDSGEDFEPFYTGRYIKDIQGRTHSFKSIESKGWRNTKVALGETQNRSLVTAHEAGQIFVFDKNSIGNLGCENIGEFAELVAKVLDRFENRSYVQFSRATLVDNTQEIERQFRSKFKLISQEDQTKEEQLFLACLEKCSKSIHYAVLRQTGDYICGPRGLIIGESAGMSAWTNGRNYIALDRKYLREQFREGLTGVIRVCSVIAHEYCHPDCSDDPDVHTHGLDFYERFHNVILSEQYAGMLSYVAVKAYTDMVKQAVKANISLGRRHEHSDRVANALEAIE